MINHDLKCIFIHIQRTGGTSIELALNGTDTWLNNPHLKHLTASQAKAEYSEYWDKYFKFAFVREPLSRHLSMLKYAPDHFYSQDPLVNNNKIQLSLNLFKNYEKLYAPTIPIEFDHRYYNYKDIINKNLGIGMMYSNILDKKIDFIGKFERLQDDFDIYAI